MSFMAQGSHKYIVHQSIIVYDDVNSVLHANITLTITRNNIEGIINGEEFNLL